MRQEGTLLAEAELAAHADERAVVLRLQAGDRAAAATLYQWYGEALFREVILPRLPVRELAEDVLRDTFRTVLERVDQWVYENDRSIYFWIRRIAINRAIDVHRSHQRGRKLEGAAIEDEAARAEAPDRPDRRLEADETRSRVEAALSGLSERYALALRLRLLQELDREECAARMGVTVGNFDVILHRACAAFRKVWQPDDE